MSDCIRENTRKLLLAFDCDNIYQFGTKQQKLRENGYIFPSKNTLRKLLDDQINQNTIRPGTISDLTAIYNRKYHDTIRSEDYLHRHLPFVNQTHVTELYEGLYYCYSKRHDHYQINEKIVNLMGFLYFYIEDGIYKVRYLGDFRDYHTLEEPYLREFLTDPASTFADLLAHAEFLNPEEKNYYGYYEGSMSLMDDYCHIELHRPADFPIKTGKHNLSIIIRRYNDDMRKRLYGAIGLLIGKAFNTDLLYKKIVLSEKLLLPEDTMIQQLLQEPTMLITDKDDFLWYNYLRGSLDSI